MDNLIVDLKFLLRAFDEKKIDFRLIKEKKFVEEYSKDIKQFLIKYEALLEESCKNKFNIENEDLIKYLLKRILNWYFYYKDKEVNNIKEKLENEIWLHIFLQKSYIHYNILQNGFVLSWIEEIDSISEDFIKINWTWKEQFNIWLLKILIESNLKNEKIKVIMNNWEKYNIHIIDWNLSI